MRDAVWCLDAETVFLNHGSFGACPRQVLARQAALREQLERNPVRFMSRELEGLLDGARDAVARFVGARPADVVPVANATTAVSAVLRSASLGAGDELLLTSHGYNAVRVAAQRIAAERGAAVRVCELPLPVDDVEGRVLAAVTPRTRLAVIDHVTSPTAVRFPVERLAGELEARGVTVLVDGAHAPGMVALDVPAVGASYYTGNLHKWVCAPKGAGFLWAREDRHRGLHPAVISHGDSQGSRGRSTYHLEFDWVGTVDPTAFLAVPAALEVMGGLVPGGWPALQHQNRERARAARRFLADALAATPTAPEAMVEAMAALRLPFGADGLQPWLAGQGIEVPIIPFEGAWLVRVSLQHHVRDTDIARLAEATLRWRGEPL